MSGAKASECEGVLILGAPRSGTTLLRRILDAHPNLACPGETGVFRAAARFLERERTGVGVEVGVLAGLAHAGFSRDEVRSRTREFVMSFHREIAQRAGKKRWVEKNAFDAFHVSGIEELCGDSVAYICLVRHGLDVAASMLELCDKSQSFLLDFSEYISRERRPLEAFSQAWVDVNQALLGLVERRPRQAVLVNYEQLAAQPDRELDRLLHFLGEAPASGLIEKALSRTGSVGLGDWKTYGRRVIDTTSIGRWRSLPPATQAAMGAIANPMLERLGYESVDTQALSSEEAQRRYELGLLLQAARAGKGQE